MSESETKHGITHLTGNSFKRRAWLFIAAIAVLLILMTTSWIRMQAAYASAEQSAHSTEACAALAHQIERLKTNPTLLSTGNQPIQDLANRIEKTAISADIPITHIVRVWPQEPRRIDDSPYKQKGTLIVVRDITLKQATTLLHRLDTGSRSLSISSIRLTASRETAASTEERWALEATLSTLIYAPRNNN